MLTNIFNCPLCYKPYDQSKNVPKILVSCGHTFCLSCMNQTLQKDAAFVCSFCPHSFISTIPELDNLPTNLFVMGQLTNINLSSSPSIKMISSPEKSNYPLCPLHNHKLKFVCLTDELLICKYCIRFGVHKGHSVLHVQDVKSEAQKKIKQLTAIAQDLQEKQLQNSPKTKVEDLKQLIQTNFDSSLHLKKMLKVKEEEFLEEIDRFFDLEVEKLLQKKHNDENILQQIGHQVHALNCDIIDSDYFTSLNLDLTSNIQVYRIPQYLTFLARGAMKSFESLSSRLSSKTMTFDSHLEPLYHQESIAVSKNFKVFPRFLQTLLNIQDGTLILDFSEIQFEQELIKSFDHLCSRANPDILSILLKFNSSDFLEILALKELCEMDFWNHSQLKTLKIQVQGHEKCNSGLEKLLITTANLKNLESFSLIAPDTEINNSVLKAVSEFPLKKNKSLQELELNFAKTQIDSEGFLELMAALSPIISRLKTFYLNLNGTQVKAISDFVKFQLSKSHHLQNFSLCLESILITKSFWRAVASLPQNFSTSLKNLVLDFRSTRIDDNDFKILHSSFIESAANLQTLELYFSFTSLTEESLKLICQTFVKIAKNLQKIVLDFSHTKIKDIGAFNVIPKFVFLETFELNLKKNSFNKKTVQQIYSDFLSNKVAMSHLKHFKIKLSKNLKKSVKILANSINDELHKINNLSE